jgi:glycosyltransferase involved in cell wall biosynthesis
MANRFDQDVVKEVADRTIEVPEGVDSYLNLNESVAKWLALNLNELFGEKLKPEIALLGGWPFFASIPVLEGSGCRTVFMDCGAVPLDGFDEGGRITQEKLRQMRKTYLPMLSHIAPISGFIAKSQSIPEAGKCGVEPILLGADHMSKHLWRQSNTKHAAIVERKLSREGFERDKGRDVKILLNLGRWEPGCYKNSEALFELVDAMIPKVPNIVVLILADHEDVNIPATYEGRIVPIGFPDDVELQNIMAWVDVGISLSRWEGFNLPLVEMQSLNKPALAFNVAAHPEVILHDWFLCETIIEMATKANAVLTGKGLPQATLQPLYRQFREKFQWSATVQRYDELFARLAERSADNHDLAIFVDVSNASRDPANSGVIRVTRRLCRQLQERCRPQFVVWDRGRGCYVYPTEIEYQCLTQFNGPQIGQHHLRSHSTDDRRSLLEADLSTAGQYRWLLLTETVLETNGYHLRKHARKLGMQVAAIFYDAIPVLRPDLVKDTVIRDNHAQYMKGIAECDVVIPISQFSAESLALFWQEARLTGGKVAPILLPGEFGGFRRESNARHAVSKDINILCVSTLEPRKNHVKLIQAIEHFSKEYPDIKWSLTLIGNRYAGSDDIVETVRRSCAADSRIHWLGIVDDARLHQAYSECTFTIYASEIEGFGLPILESLWHGKPCICHERGVMAEIATGGGCFTVDVTDSRKLSAAIGTLATDAVQYSNLVDAAIGRRIKNWQEYASEFVQTLRLVSLDKTIPQGNMITNEGEESMIPKDSLPTWQDILYTGCLTDEWQMNDSERLGLMAILARLQPKCAIEIGTYRGGSLSLISQYAKAVFSIDIDPTIPDKFRQFGNVSFFTGPSHLILPMLLDELCTAGHPVEFVLIDGDHSTEGIKRDIEIMLDYVPSKPLVIIMHDGFNPGCRQGMMQADWQKSPYVQYVDLDFVPGRVMENGGAGDGEMWGGLAMAYMSPTKRVGEVALARTSNRTFEESRNRCYGEQKRA